MGGWRAPVRKRLIRLWWNRKSQSWSDKWDTHASCSHLRVSGELKTTLNWAFFQLVSRLSGSKLDGRTLKSLKSKVRTQLLIWISHFERVSSLLRIFFSETHVSNCPNVICMLIIQLCIRASVRACLPVCWWGSGWQLHNSPNSTVDAGFPLLCYKRDKLLNHGSLIVPWAPNASACFELIVTQRERADSPGARRNDMHGMAVIY